MPNTTSLRRALATTLLAAALTPGAAQHAAAAPERQAVPAPRGEAAQIERDLAYALTFRAVDDPTRSAVARLLEDPDRAAADRVLLGMGEPAFRVLRSLSARDPDGIRARANDVMTRLQQRRRDVIRRGLDHDVGLLAAAGGDATKRLRAILPPEAPAEDVEAWWSLHRSRYRWAPAVDRWVRRGDFGEDACPPLRLEGRDGVRLARTERLFNFGSPLTVEVWLRWRKGGEQYVVGDEAWPTMHPDVRAAGEVGFTLRRRPSPHGDRIDITLGKRGRGWWALHSDPLPFTPAGGEHPRHPDEWHHIAAVSDGRVMRLFHDGLCVGVEPLPSGGVALGVGDAWVGAAPHAWRNRVAHFDVRAYRVTEGARYVDDFVPQERLVADDGTLLVSAARDDDSVVGDGSGNGRVGLVHGAERIAPLAGDSVSRALAELGARPAELVVVEAEHGDASDGWFVSERAGFGNGRVREIWTRDEPGPAGHRAAVPFRVPSDGRYRVWFAGAG